MAHLGLQEKGGALGNNGQDKSLNSRGIVSNRGRRGNKRRGGFGGRGRTGGGGEKGEKVEDIPIGWGWLEMEDPWTQEKIKLQVLLTIIVQVPLEEIERQ